MQSIEHSLHPPCRSLQTAVGCYLDYCSLQLLPSMKIVQGQHVNAQQQAFQLQNDGIERWPNGCYLTSPIQTQRINVPSLRPGETCDILADLMPTQPAIMWRMCTPNGWYFGGESQLQLNLNLNLHLQQIIICICSRSSSASASDHHLYLHLIIICMCSRLSSVSSQDYHLHLHQIIICMCSRSSSVSRLYSFPNRAPLCRCHLDDTAGHTG